MLVARSLALRSPDEGGASVTPAPAAPVTATPTAPAAAAPSPAAVPAVADKPRTVVDENPLWLSERLKREKIAALRAVGAKVGKNDDPDAIAAEIKAKNEDRKGKLKATRQELDTTKSKATQLEQANAAQAAILKVYAETELGQLNDKQREFVKLTAGDDVAKQLETISMFKAQGMLTPVTPVAADPAVNPAVPATPPAPKTIDAPASTSPASPAPTPASPQTTDIRAEYRNLKAASPYLAAQFILNHPELLNPS